MSAPLACPFCGKPPQSMAKLAPSPRSPDTWRIWCCVVLDANTEADAIAAWNRRAVPRDAQGDSPASHLRNALQILNGVREMIAEQGVFLETDVDALERRLTAALRLLDA